MLVIIEGAEKKFENPDAIRNYALLNNLMGVRLCALSNLLNRMKLVVPVSKR